MGFSRGPKLVTDGLLLALDAANDKSFKGEPTTNLLSAVGSNAEIERSGNSYPYYAENINSVVQSNWTSGNNTLTISFEGKRDFSVGGTGDGGDGYPVFYIYFTDWSWAATVAITSYDWSYNKQTFTMPNPSGKTVFFSIYHMNAGNPGRSYSRKHQIEFKSYATPFVNGSRGTTVATGGGWADKSGNNNNVELVNGTTFNSSNRGSIQFDGVNDWGSLNVNSSSLITNDFTFTAWAKRNGDSSTGIGGIFGNHFHPQFSGANMYFINNNTQVVFSAGNGTSRPAHTVNIPVSNLNWNFYTIRYSGTTYQFYFNGQLLDSRTAVVVQSANSNQYAIGLWAASYTSEYYLNGNISQCLSYRRALSANEILQNFNATKSRYGL